MSLCLPDFAQLTSFQIFCCLGFLLLFFVCFLKSIYQWDIYCQGPISQVSQMSGSRGVWWLEEEEGRGFGTAAVAGVALGKLVKNGKSIFSYFRNFQIALRGSETN